MLENTITQDQLKAISIDQTNTIANAFQSFAKLINSAGLLPVLNGSVVNIYEIDPKLATAPAEGEDVDLSQIKRLTRQQVMSLSRYKTRTTIEAQQASGATAVVNSDRELEHAIWKDIRKKLVGTFDKAQKVESKVKTFQGAISAASTKLDQIYPDSTDNGVLVYTNVETLNDFLATTQSNIPTSADSTGKIYVQNYNGATILTDNSIPVGHLYVTTKDNLQIAYVPVNAAAFADFGLTTDESGLVGISHQPDQNSGSLDSYFYSYLTMYAQFENLLVDVNFSQGSSETPTEQEEPEEPSNPEENPETPEEPENNQKTEDGSKE